MLLLDVAIGIEFDVDFAGSQTLVEVEGGSAIDDFKGLIAVFVIDCAGDRGGEGFAFRDLLDGAEDSPDVA